MNFVLVLLDEAGFAWTVQTIQPTELTAKAVNIDEPEKKKALQQ